MNAIHETRHTLGLAMIMKDEIEDLDRIVKDYAPFFDKIYVTVTDKRTYTALRKRFPDEPVTNSVVELSYFKWIDHFGKARLYNQQQVKTDYWMWMDLDDEIEGVENLHQVLEYMDTNDLDLVGFPYDCVRRVNYTEPGAISWRERIIRTASKLEWGDEAIHESINAQGDTKLEFISDVMIKHRKTAEQVRLSEERNTLILEKDWQQAHRPVTAYYLGMHLGKLGDCEGAIEKFLFAAEHGEIRAQRFAAWQNLCESYLQIGQYTLALAATNKAIAIDPDHPGPWYHRFAVYMVMGNPGTALQSAEIAMSKRIQGDLAILLNHDLSWFQYRGPFNVAQAYLSIGNVERAYQIYNEVKKIAPQYIEEQSTADVQWSTIFEQAHVGVINLEAFTFLEIRGEGLRPRI